ncbi:gag pre-integrs domain-containing protein [Abeliophyllum distichum]|uniref:Gag pre-integrs domain-containing protein n=1 Tax=Abeliophyllum distichum TaxID=126358 RepID=A0ABD1PDG1_9LAMI
MAEPAFDEAQMENGESLVPEDAAALRKSSRVICPPRRYDPLITNKALLIEKDKPTTYTESKSNVDSKRWTKDMFLVYGENELRVQGYADASFQSDKDDSKSQSGYVFTLNSDAIS